jgi:hypothetical protein
MSQTAKPKTPEQPAPPRHNTTDPAQPDEPNPGDPGSPFLEPRTPTDVDDQLRGVPHQPAERP